MRSLRASEVRTQVLFSLFFVVLCLLFLFPVYALLLASFRPGRDLIRFGITLKTLVPRNLVLTYLASLATAQGGAYVTWFRNSLMLVVLLTSLSLLLSSMVGYGLGIYRFKGKKIVLSLVLLVIMVPLQILILPLYRLLIFLRSMNTFHGIMLPFIVRLSPSSSSGSSSSGSRSISWTRAASTGCRRSASFSASWRP